MYIARFLEYDKNFEPQPTETILKIDGRSVGWDRFSNCVTIGENDSNKIHEMLFSNDKFVGYRIEKKLGGRIEALRYATFINFAKHKKLAPNRSVSYFV